MRPGEIIFRHTEPVMGTVVSIDVRPQGLPMARTRSAVTAACELLHRADDVFSLFRPDTPLARLTRGEIALVDCPPEVAEVTELCDRAKAASGGWFDPWGLPDGFDPTGLVKGWAAREAARVLEAFGIGAGMVNAAGDIATFGTPWRRDAWRVGIRSPESPELLSCVRARRSRLGRRRRARREWGCFRLGHRSRSGAGRRARDGARGRGERRPRRGHGSRLRGDAGARRRRIRQYHGISGTHSRINRG
jgi:thiamine biosynthesis lipoprotein